jgi:hypothetical protein
VFSLSFMCFFFGLVIEETQPKKEEEPKKMGKKA